MDVDVMQIRNLFSKIVRSYFDDNLDIHVQSFNLLGFAGMAACASITAISLVQGSYIDTVVCAFFFFVALFLICVTGKKVAGVNISYRISSWIVVATVFMTAFPALFFTSGGYKGGMPGFFIFAIIYTTILFSKYERVIALTIEFTIYTGCCLIAFFYPEIVLVGHSEMFYLIEALAVIFVCGSLLMLVILLLLRIYHSRQIQIIELNRELKSRNESLMKYDKMKTDFLAAVGHEINKPLTAISGSNEDTMDLLQENPINMAEIMTNYERIKSKVFLIDKIVTDLMDTAAMESGRLSLSRELCSLSKFLRIVCDAEFCKIDKNNNKLSYSLQPDLPQLWIDPERIAQVMTNLLANATLHTKGGEITVALTRTDNRQIVSVSDTGEGMEPELVEIALKEYMTSRESNQYWRHGFGLFVCRQIVLAHGGEIWVESEEGRGTSISFTLKEGCYE